MTMAQIAKSIGVSVRTIYRKLDKNGINIGTIRDSSGEITSDGAQVIASLFDGVRHDASKDRHAKDTECHATNDAMTQELSIENAALRAKIEGLERENNLLRQMVEKAEAAAADWKAQAETAQRVQLAQIQLIPARVGVWQRIKETFRGGKENE